MGRVAGVRMSGLRWLIVNTQREGNVKLAIPADAVQPGDRIPVIVGITEEEPLPDGMTFENSETFD